MKQEEFVTRTLIQCTENIGALAPSHPHYMASKKAFVISHIDSLIRTNTEEAIKNSKLRLGFFGSYLLPDDHILVRCLHEALSEIEPAEFVMMEEASDISLPSTGVSRRGLPPSEAEGGVCAADAAINDDHVSTTTAAASLHSQPKRPGGKPPTSSAIKARI